MIFNFPRREEDVYNFFRLLTVIFILAVLPAAIILTQRETRIKQEAKEKEALAPPESGEPADIKTEYLYPEVLGVGWVKSNDSVVSHLGDDDIHSGFWAQDEYIGLLQFNLSSLPEKAKIVGVQFSLIGKSDAHLGEGGEWRFQILESAVDKSFSKRSFADFIAAAAEVSLSPVIKGGDLKVAKETSFTLSEEEIGVVRERFAATKQVSLRIMGPSPDQSFLGKKQEFNLFTWESGYGEGTFKIKPVMEILYTL